MNNIMTLPAVDAEQIAYSEHLINIARLFARIADLEAERDALQSALDDMELTQ